MLLATWSSLAMEAITFARPTERAVMDGARTDDEAGARKGALHTVFRVMCPEKMRGRGGRRLAS